MRKLVRSLKDSAGQAGIVSVGFLCDDVHIHGGSVAQEAVNGRHVEIFPPSLDGRAAEDHLRHMLLAGELGGGRGNIFASSFDYFCAEAFSELDVGCQ
jgi:hypothetical protein